MNPRDRLVVATAGHVDHGKSALVRALTGIEPDRWEEERRRGLTLDLGFAWTRLDSGREVAFVDVPGHERFLDNALAGLAATPAVCFVLAADQGWQRQSEDHRDAVAALGITAGIIVITRCDLTGGPDSDQVAAVTSRAQAEFAETGLAQAPIVVTSARTGEGLEALRARLERLQPAAGDAEAPLRVWVDRAFSISGAGTVVTGTLAAGALRRGDRLALAGRGGPSEVQVRGLHRQEEQIDQATPISRVAVNLRGADADQVHRGDVLLSPQRWHLSRRIDVERTWGGPLTQTPEQLVLHCGTASVPVRVRALGEDHARLTLSRALPLRLDDAAVLVDPGADARVRAGLRVLDVDPPTLRRRGDARRRAAELTGRPRGGDLAAEVRRRGAVAVETLARYGLRGAEDAVGGDHPHKALRRLGAMLVDAQALQDWAAALHTAVVEAEAREPLSAGVPRGAAADLLRLPPEARAEPAVLDAVVAAAGLGQHAGRLRTRARADIGEAEPGLRALEDRLAEDPFLAPEAAELESLGLGRRELAAAEARGRVLRLDDTVILLPSAPAQAMGRLAGLSDAFTLSQARRALGTTRRVAVPLLEHLDRRGWTRRIDDQRRIVVR